MGSTQQERKAGLLRAISQPRFMSPRVSSAAAILPREEEGGDVGAIDTAVLIDVR